MFAEPSYANSAEYTQFWANLNKGIFDAGEYKRIGKNGKEVWIQASYNPIMDLNGNPFKVVKYATDVTAEKLIAADFSGQLDAIGKSQAVIEFNMDGIILDANENFLTTLGYTLEEIKGQHHSLFVEPDYKVSVEYKQFWEQLNKGIYDSAEYKRIGKNGIEVWIQASYNPIMDLNGKPFKVVKYATDVSDRKAAVAEVIKAMDGLSQGDLTQTMDGNFEGDFADLQETINGSLSTLAEMVTEIRSASTQIGSAAGEISQGNTDLSQRTEEQASSLEETASSMEELTSTVRQNADNSKQANTLAAGARTEAESGGQVIDQTITAMTAINEASNKIEDIISVIDEIAFQTNLLALNAAVEAARAGEQGRGFAVVASEVRSLAQRSAAAAKEIKVLIKDSVEKVDEGTRLVDESGTTLASIVNSVKKVSDIIAEIAAASSEQSAGIDQVGKAITQLDEVTQQNAALVEEAAAASESMDEQAKSMNSQMEFFTVDESQMATPVAKPASKVAKAMPKAAKPTLKAAKPVAPQKAASADEWEEF